MSVEMMAMLLVSVIQGQVVSVYNTEKQEACEHLDQVHQTPHGSSVPQSASLHEMAYLASAGVTGGLFLLSSLVLFFGVKEQWHESVQHDTHCPDDRTQPSYLSSLKMLISHIPYQRLVLGFVFSVLAFQSCSWIGSSFSAPLADPIDVCFSSSSIVAICPSENGKKSPQFSLDFLSSSQQ
ncbi:hypothetical protein ILYODFUR_010830 [Ilyodon furcidens]|uniref:Uncharacterized protein n=1 Tax=Ilyodon furcidens TaxID=33524 RepID=A0ABV0UUE8_9TELE